MTVNIKCDELRGKMSAMSRDLSPDNHRDIDPSDLFRQIAALRETQNERAAKFRGISAGVVYSSAQRAVELWSHLPAR